MKLNESSMEQEQHPSFQWRMRGKYRSNFSPYFTYIYINESDSWFLMGGNGTRDTNLQYINKKLRIRSPIP